MNICRFGRVFESYSKLNFQNTFGVLLQRKNSHQRLLTMSSAPPNDSIANNEAPVKTAKQLKNEAKKQAKLEKFAKKKLEQQQGEVYDSTIPKPN